MDDQGLDTLLALDGTQYGIQGDFWVKFEVRRVEATPNIPHGIKYSLTLHHKSGTRLLGFDNAHAPKIKRRKFAGRREEWDHRHYRSVVSDYFFDSAAHLIEDFWKHVDEILREEGI
ncbi:hypothetical protein KV699_19895 [Vreelandella titanicae]|jgi:hypothetical protein|uniref:Uncharacterized protein n=1 Tax=Vreelandella titanicae TaxID=664683 RepID=A0AAP9T1V1_9GAMM|nr:MULTISPECIES: DUF6516 family protein [Halomonas]UEQ03310.1 DUF6516 family protein [Halomonas profundus]MCD1588417.1 DUF6516 family protein [Halomonas sp. IOP_14]QKS25278.1 hypothetical protein FX987_03074 [Halomonas titanicae]CDG53571.1 conserved hypothetical protein [Halomonas sp. A3H3]SDJ20863.1 hypothetical protein SAMN04487867_12820 [Halomonas titanicae]|tara:strand:+ start:854 stop:1204 length:351 start_codon:yes stop_codon:yes gene_type:complete